MAVKHPSPTSLFGWCMPNTEDHKNCRVAYLDWNNEQRTCSCTCHTKPNKRATRRNSNNK
jgi:hypothetical protein